MIVVHHLNNSRSQRVLWMLEELGLPYEIRHYTRRMMQAPPELVAVHPLGKSPVITDGAVTVAESGAIAEYLVRAAGGRFGRPADEAEGRRYDYFMHYAEGSLMPLIVMLLVVAKMPPLGWLARRMFRKRLDQHLTFVDGGLAGREWFAGDAPSAADVMMSFPLEFASGLFGVAAYPRVAAWLDKIHARPAYAAGLERGGPTIYR